MAAKQDCLRKLVDHKDAETQTDGYLLEQFSSAHDQRAFEELVKRHGCMVLGVCRRILGKADEAEDAFQATFLVLARKARSLDKRGSVAGWLYTVAHHLALRTKADAQ